MRKKSKSQDPLYIQIARTLTQQIANGSYPVGSQLPSEDELSSHFSVSRYTVREALRQLRNDGLISSRKGAGTVVNEYSSSNSYSFGALSIEELMQYAEGTSVSFQSISMVTIDRALSRRTGLAIGEDWLAGYALGYKDKFNLPIGYAEYYINQDFAAVGRLLKRHNGPIFPLIEDLFCVKIVEVHQEITAKAVSPEVAQHLMIEPDVPVLEVRQRQKTSDGRIAQYTIITHPAQRYRHSVTMHRINH